MISPYARADYTHHSFDLPFYPTVLWAYVSGYSVLCPGDTLFPTIQLDDDDDDYYYH